MNVWKVGLVWWVCSGLAWGATDGRAAVQQGIRGRAALGGVLMEGAEVRVYAYRPGSFGPLTQAPVAARAVTGRDGSYVAELPPGRYVVEAIRKAGRNAGLRPEAGDLYCLYLGSPVTVGEGAWTPVGFNLVQVPPEQRRHGDQTRIRGRVTLKGRDVEKVYLYAYDEVRTAFHGPARIVQPVASGSFSMRVPPGTYYLVARKRTRGGAQGPLEVGDLFNFYPGNPVVLGQGDEVVLEVPMVERLGLLEEEGSVPQGLAVRVVDGRGRPAAGYYVLAYASKTRSGPPLVTSGRTDADGRAFLPLSSGQSAFLRARRSLGGPLESGELFADGASPGPGSGDTTLTLRKAP